LVSHVTQALQVLGASTGGNIADYISSNFTTEQGVPYEKGRKLHYMVNAILSSPKYKYLFLKDQVLKDEKRSLWRLKQPGDQGEEEPTPLNLSLASLVPATVSLSSLIPPTSPSLSLIASSGGDAEAPNAITPIETPVPIRPSHSINYIAVKSEFEERGGGSDGSSDDKKPGQPRTTEHPLIVSPPSAFSPQSPLSPSDPCSPSGDTPLQLDTPTSLSSRRKKRKGSGLDLSSSSSSVESVSSKYSEEVPQIMEDKKRRLDSAAA